MDGGGGRSGRSEALCLWLLVWLAWESLQVGRCSSTGNNRWIRYTVLCVRICSQGLETITRNKEQLMLTGTTKGGQPGNSLSFKLKLPHPRNLGRVAAARHLLLAANQAGLGKQPPSNVGKMKRFLPSHRT